MSDAQNPKVTDGRQLLYGERLPRSTTGPTGTPSTEVATIRLSDDGYIAVIRTANHRQGYESAPGSLTAALRTILFEFEPPESDQ